MEPDNPYTYLKGYKIYDAVETEVGEIEQTVYDAPSDVLKYIIVDGRPSPAESVDIDADQERVHVPYDKETIESAPELRGFSGEFDRSLREHYDESS